MSKYKCELCNSDMVLKETMVVSSTSYQMWYCPKCKKKTAKTA